ncbi:MAG: hypothetical protein Fur0024_5100 [Patescibacteria group bacterium]
MARIGCNVEKNNKDEFSVEVEVNDPIVTLTINEPILISAEKSNKNSSILEWFESLIMNVIKIQINEGSQFIFNKYNKTLFCILVLAEGRKKIYDASDNRILKNLFFELCKHKGIELS